MLIVFFMLKKILNISKYSIFTCFSFFLLSKKISYIFNYVFSSMFKLSIIVWWKKLLKKKRACYTPWKAFENTVFKVIRVIFNQY